MIRRLQRQRAKLIADARALVDRAEEEGRDLSGEEQAQYDEMWEGENGINELRNRIERAQRQEAAEREMGESDMPGTRRQDPRDEGEPSAPEFRSRGLQQLDTGWQEQPAWRRLLATTEPTYGAAFREWMRSGRLDQRAALQVDVNTAGGYLVPPMQFVDELLRGLDDQVHVRSRARVFSLPTADSLGVPTLEKDPGDPAWTRELDFGEEDMEMSFGRRELRPHPLAKHIRISNTLLRRVPGVEALVRERLGYKFAVAMENSYFNGDGAGKPLGIFTPSADGVPLSRDVSEDNTATEITFDGLISAKYAMNQGYWAGAEWFFHTDAVKKLAKIKDNEGRYIWRESVRVGEPDMVLGFPLVQSEFVPNTFTSGKYVGALANWGYYWIADALDMQFQRLMELFVQTNQFAIVGRMESDGQPVQPEAFVRVKLG